ncbi:MAG TPA: catalase [Solimonas sp.]|nr:catalase [Solimonas sp.]
MATQKKAPSRRKAAVTGESLGTILSTVSAPSTAQPDPLAESLKTEAQRRLARQKAGAQKLAAAMPDNPLKPMEHGLKSGHSPTAGKPLKPADPMDTASTLTEDTVSDKTGGPARAGFNPGNDPLDRARVDSGGRALTTNMGAPIGDNQNSLKAGLRGPTLMEDFVLREKITHFDHERIPERIVHARGSGAHGYFECYKPLTRLTRAAPFARAGKRTPVFVRFSTVAGERGSTDLARDVRGFAVKFYTEEGNWDIVGNNIPVFFIQDAMKFPDLVHAVKPEPNNQIPQAASAHDTFWDFVSLMPESAHMLMWVMSDRAIPRSYRTMQGFGVHTFRLVNAAGESVFVKFHWSPVAGTHSVVWDEAVKISGADSDFHRRDLWEAIESGAFPEWELGLQVFTEKQADGFTFDVLDATKLVPEELVPVQPVGRMVLNRNPDNFFAETEQVAFGTANVVPGIDFSNDPLLQGRHHSYFDTQLSRLGGPNFHELPINASVAQVHNNQRDGLHRQAIPRGRVAYEPNSLGGGCPFQAGMKGFVSFPAPVFEDKVRGKPEKFADHYSQATLFWNSQSPVEKAHIIGAFRFELTRVQTQAVRERVLSVLANIADQLARGVADGLGIPVPAAQALAGRRVQSEVEESPALSLFARPGDGSIIGRRVALLVCDGIDGVSLRAVHKALGAAGAVARFVGARLGTVQPEVGAPIHVEITTETAPSVLWDAVVLPGGAAAQATLADLGQVKEFLKDQYRHCKPMLVLGEALQLLEAAGIPQRLANGEADPGIVLAGSQRAARKGKSSGAAADDFIRALSMHRHFDRETDPPRI